MPRSPLHEEHLRLGARFVDFAGWEMPVQYQGVLAEHATVRDSVGVFDVSHLGRFTVEGPGSSQLLLRLLCNDISDIEPGRAQYTMSLNERAGVEDDIIVWRWAAEQYWVIPNGTNDQKILARFRASAPPGVEIESIRDDTVMLAVQGRQAPRLLENVLGVTPARFRLGRAEWNHGPVWMAGTGYTGEPGGEVVAPREAAVALFRALCAVGATPAGLGSRDTLRLEMGYPLWGQDLDPDTTPLEAALDWVVGWDHEFIGRESLMRQREEGLPKRRIGFVMEGRPIARHGYRLRSRQSVGEVTSGNLSPTLKRGIGLGFLSPPVDTEAEVEVEIRGAWLPVRRREPPFIERT